MSINGLGNKPLKEIFHTGSMSISGAKRMVRNSPIVSGTAAGAITGGAMGAYSDNGSFLGGAAAGAAAGAMGGLGYKYRTGLMGAWAGATGKLYNGTAPIGKRSASGIWNDTKDGWNYGEGFRKMGRGMGLWS